MLVLSRKTKEQIMIGDDVRITLLRIDGNKVRIGIDAPKDVRVLRSEIMINDAKSSDDSLDSNAQISDREEAFAHPQKPSSGKNRLSEAKLFVGSVDRKGQHARLEPHTAVGLHDGDLSGRAVVATRGSRVGRDWLS